ncbi:YihY/virulence factor BrkB family protein [Pseudobacter ginsenosidimutans]|uniref:Membrane protein n=1 Tax=Pseudobacter ginsenosidimutans TaxID=661488 RepID=A0A4Q7MDW4_9BACT|nr:YihY/virulence factor BrkB family protein [Pseudobacter ginsenosidimutans]QEC42671.1 YihY/virulence factor BrkB family protein [Pseudobacter ginsenosidimutans]RZS65178.1 membrane protein [Pseudobacter ginsenosidimutans]
MKKLPKPATILQLLKKAFGEFQQNDPLRMAAATAFFATFALPAIILILIVVFGLVMDRRFVGRSLVEALSGVLGPNSAEEIRNTLRNVRTLASTWYIATGGFIFLLFVSTTLFKVIKDSLNQLWRIRQSNGRGVVRQLKQRGTSFLVILFAGIFFLATLMVEGGVALLRQQLPDLLPGEGSVIWAITSQVVSLSVVTCWFSILFRYLPDGHTTWRITMGGAFFTALLFTLGKFLLRFLLSYSNMSTVYGTSTSFVLMLLFIFYCAFIFYYGACFLKVWAKHKNKPIIPRYYAEAYTWQQVKEESLDR